MSSRRDILKGLVGAVVAPAVPLPVAPARIIRSRLYLSDTQQQLMLWFAKRKTEALMEALAGGLKPPLEIQYTAEGVMQVVEYRPSGESVVRDATRPYQVEVMTGWKPARPFSGGTPELREEVDYA